MPRDEFFAVWIVTSPDEGAVVGFGVAGFGVAVGAGVAVGDGVAAGEGVAADADWLLGGAAGLVVDEPAALQAEATAATMTSGMRSRAIDAGFVQLRFTIELLRLVAPPTPIGPRHRLDQDSLMPAGVFDAERRRRSRLGDLLPVGAQRERQPAEGEDRCRDLGDRGYSLSR